MDRRKLLATTGAVSLTAAAAVVAVGANFGLFGLAGDGAKAGHFEPVSSSATTAPRTTPSTEVVYVDVQDPSAGAPAAGSTEESYDHGTIAPAPVPAAPPPVTTATVPHRDDDHDEIEYHEDDEAEHEDSEHESEPDDD
jgi:hypothetical protein